MKKFLVRLGAVSVCLVCFPLAVFPALYCRIRHRHRFFQGLTWRWYRLVLACLQTI